jgi:DNA-binding response OmpR family regulator
MKRILFVDDDPDIVEMLAYCANKAGFDVLTANRGHEAFQIAHWWHPHLIVLDVLLPDSDGISICEMLRRSPATAAIPVVVMTALSGHLSRLIALDAGATAYIAKPFSPQQVLSQISGLLGALVTGGIEKT